MVEWVITLKTAQALGVEIRLPGEGPDVECPRIVFRRSLETRFHVAKISEKKRWARILKRDPSHADARLLRWREVCAGIRARTPVGSYP